MKNIKLTKNFRLFEAAQTRQVEYVEDNRRYVLDNKAKAVLTLNMVELIREILGGHPIYLSSLARMPELNQKIGGVSSSQHLLLEAADWTRWGKTSGHEVIHDAKKVSAYFKEHEIMFGQHIFEERNTPDGRRFWNHTSLGYPFRPLEKCRQVASIVDGKFVLGAQLSLDAWR